MNKGQKLYKEAKRLILGGNMLLSKRPEMFLPNLWPSYFSKSQDVNVWDLQGKRYTDMICAVGQNSLGYSNREINNEVIKCIKKGNMTTLNCPEEVSLTKKLLSLHPWAQMAKYARTGGEANALAIRIGRAASGKDGVAICGYHGWHDWYLSANIKGKDALSKHLLSGLTPLGVPKVLKNTVHPFQYGNFQELEKIVKKKDVGVIKMEVARNAMPDKEFLQKVRDLATRKKIILIFDECTSGFRRNLGGIHMLCNVYPDIAIFGKALGNGFAITAVIGKKNVMKKAERTFMSSTFWTERIGFVAGLKTIQTMGKIKSWKLLISNGKYFNNKIKNLAKKYELKVNISGIESITSFKFISQNNLEYKTFISQEMLKKNYLASNLIFLNIFHTAKVTDRYIELLDPVFKKIKSFQNGNNVRKFLKNGICHQTFERLND